MIFIIGLGRSGSGMLMNVLNNHPEIFIDTEINYRFLFKKCIYSELKKIDNLKRDDNAIKAVELIFSGNIPNSIPIYGEIKFDDFKREFLSSNRTYKSLFELLIKLKNVINNKKRIGAKFPVHFSYLKMLLKWYPESKIIFLTRDPRAVFVSELKAKRKYTDARQYPIGKNNLFFKWSVLFYVVIQWVWAQRIYNKYLSEFDLYLLKYESLVENPIYETKKLCDFLECEFYDYLIDIPVDNSSFNDSISKGFNKIAIDRWKNEIKKFDKLLVEIITRNQRKKIGY